MLAVLLLVTLILLLLNAFFVLAEFATVKVRPTRVEALVDRGDSRAKVLQDIQQHLDEYLSVCQVGITFASIGLGFAGKPAFQQILEPLLQRMGITSSAATEAAAVTAAYVLVSFLHILVGELVPKSIAIRRAEASGLWIALPLRICHAIFLVPLWLLNTSANGILRLLGLSSSAKEPAHSEDEIRIILEQSQTTGLMSFRRLLLIENIFDMGDLRVRDAMHARRAVKILQTTASWDDHFQVIRDSRFSRYPLVDPQTDKPLGIIHVKDLLLLGPHQMAHADLRKLARPYLTTTEDTLLENFLTDMQHHRRQLAVVQNREGQWTGIITLEDILEEIVGAIEDEFAAEKPIFLGDALRERCIVLDLQATSMRQAIMQILAQVPTRELPLPADKIARAVLEREAAMSTYLGNGLATPHARLEGIEKPVLLFARSDQGVPVESTTEKAHLFFMLLTPSSAPRLQVRLLARIAGLMSSEYLVERLREAPSPTAILEAIRAGGPIVLR